MNITVTDINTGDVERLWPKVKGMLQLAVDRNQGEFNLDDIQCGLNSGVMRLWVAYDNDTNEILSAAVCEIRNFPKRRICYIVLMAGEGFDDWNWAITCIEDWARENGADALAAYTRRGFIKTMKNYGYAEVYSVIQKELTDRRIH